MRASLGSAIGRRRGRSRIAALTSTAEIDAYRQFVLAAEQRPVNVPS